MVSIILEVKRNDWVQANQFYNPAGEEFKRRPRTNNGIEKAIKEMTKTANKYDWIVDYRFKVYNGKYESYKKDCELLCVINSKGEVIE